jgi:hypothetical protein
VPTKTTRRDKSGAVRGRPSAGSAPLKEPNATHRDAPPHGHQVPAPVHLPGRYPDRGRDRPHHRPRHGEAGAAVVGAGITMEGRRAVPDVDEAAAEVWLITLLGWAAGPTTRYAPCGTPSRQPNAIWERHERLPAGRAAGRGARCDCVTVDEPRCPNCGPRTRPGYPRAGAVGRRCAHARLCSLAIVLAPAEAQASLRDRPGSGWASGAPVRESTAPKYSAERPEELLVAS